MTENYTAQIHWDMFARTVLGALARLHKDTPSMRAWKRTSNKAHKVQGGSSSVLYFAAEGDLSDSEFFSDATKRPSANVARVREPQATSTTQWAGTL